MRKLTITRGELCVLTGPLFQGGDLRRIHGRVLVPSHIYKVVYDPHRKEAGAYLVANNSDTQDYQRVSVTDLEQIAGMSLLPGVSSAIKATAMALPESQPQAHKGR